jgi:hypothetical protein
VDTFYCFITDDMRYAQWSVYNAVVERVNKESEIRWARKNMPQWIPVKVEISAGQLPFGARRKFSITRLLKQLIP